MIPSMTSSRRSPIAMVACNLDINQPETIEPGVNRERPKFYMTSELFILYFNILI